MPTFQRTVKRVQDADDMPSLSAADDTKGPVWDDATQSWVMAAGGGGSSDHAALTNLDYASAAHTEFAGTDSRGEWS